MALRRVGSIIAQQSRRPATSGSRQLSFFTADHGKLGTHHFHTVNTALLVLAPVAFILPTKALEMPIDLALSVAIPVHSHIAMNYVITDYVPKFFGKAAIGPARALMLGMTGVTFLGLTKLSFTAGLTSSIKGLWIKDKK